jgi:glycosyltransferase involved in cell wall biosynthesis
MKIGLVGNMNNNNFAILRYFRDLGVDANLLLYSNDGQGVLDHFAPGADTWEIARWAPFIHQTNIPNSVIVAQDFPYANIIAIRSKLRRLAGLQPCAQRVVTPAEISQTYAGYDRLVASGSTPAALARVGRWLDVFYPYGIGVEFLASSDFSRKLERSIFRKKVYNKMRELQLKGLYGVGTIINTDPAVTGEVLERYGLPSLSQSIPMVYNREKIPEDPQTLKLREIHSVICSSNFTILHHARLMWTRKRSDPRHKIDVESKNSHWLINAFAELCRLRPSVRSRLLIVEYGPDITETKQLVEQLGISGRVTWLPKMSRKELVWILKRVSVGVGEFYSARSLIWGGTGWEALAYGKPLLQAFRFVKGEFERFYGCPPPPMLAVESESDILKQLLFACDYPKAVEELGFGGEKWFNSYNGINLAKKWLNIIIESRASQNGEVKGR